MQFDLFSYFVLYYYEYIYYITIWLNLFVNILCKKKHNKNVSVNLADEPYVLQFYHKLTILVHTNQKMIAILCHIIKISWSCYDCMFT